MWEYSEKVNELYRNPKNAGTIEDADAVGEAGSLTCGDMLKLYLKIDKDGIIRDAKFQTFGCGSAVASSSILTEMIIGKHIDEAKKITNKDIVDALGGLPPEKMHCSVMGHEALEAAVADYYGEDAVPETKSKVICQCFDVTEDAIVAAIKEGHLKTVEDVTNYTKAGGACGRCKSAIQNILDRENAPKMTKTQLILKVNNVIDKYVSDELRKDGGDIELIDVEDNKVYIKLTGKCHACKNAKLTFAFVQTALREHINPEIEVIRV